MGQSITLQTGAWYGDQAIELDVPETWDVTIHHPRSAKPLNDQEILEKLEAPVDQMPLSELCRGKSSPLIIVDDLNRPTPAEKIVSFLLDVFQQENIPLANVTLLMATGTHGPPPADGMEKKVGRFAASNCEILNHDCYRNIKKIGKTSFGTPVHINEAVLKSDLVIGVGGIYPNHTAGFGGGAKIILGVLGMRSIFHLHNTHERSGWGADGINGSFRKDLEEIADMAGLHMVISVQIDMQREIIQVHCGNPREYFPEAVSFCREVFTAPRPHDADVVISNAYPNDLSLTFVKLKGVFPLKYCPRSATRIVIASCYEGVGLHNLYPYVNIPKFFKIRQVLRSFLALPFAEVVQKIVRRLLAFMPHQGSREGTTQGLTTIVHDHPVWFYRPGQSMVALPTSLPGLKTKQSWSEIIETIHLEQGEGRKLKVAVYPCAFLQNIL